MKVSLTEHARMRLKERQISIDDVVRIVKSPARRFYDPQTTHLIAVGPRNDGEQWLVTAYEETETGIEVITVIATSKSLNKIITNRISSRRWLKLKVRYDPRADILYILIREGPVSDTDEVDKDVWFEYDSEGNVIGIEIWNAGERVIQKSLLEIEKYVKAANTTESAKA